MIEPVIRTGRAVSIEVRTQLNQLISSVLENLSNIPRPAARCQPTISRSFYLRSPVRFVSWNRGALLAFFRQFPGCKDASCLSLRLFGNSLPQTSSNSLKITWRLKRFTLTLRESLSANVDPVAEAVFSVTYLMPETSGGSNQHRLNNAYLFSTFLLYQPCTLCASPLESF